MSAHKNVGYQVMGVDFSLTGTGWVLRRKKHFTGNPKVDYPIVNSGVISTKAGGNLYDRCSEIVGTVLSLCDDNTAIAVEDYAVSKFGNSVIPTITLGSIFRFICRAQGQSYYTVPPTTVKKFTTGKGVAPKDMMMLHVFKKWDFTPKDNNEADAYAICQMLIQRTDMACAGTKAEKEALEKMVYTDNS